MKTAFAVLAVLALSVSLVQATPIAVPNYSFEDTTELYAPVGWEYDSTGGGYPYLNSDTGRVMPTDGSYYCDTQVPEGGVATMTSAASLAQAVVGNTYTLAAQIGNDNYQVAGVLAQIAILIDGVAAATSPAYDTTLGAEGVMVDLSLNYVAVAGDAGKDITVQLIGTDPGTTGVNAQWDNVRLTQVPEPATLALLGVGAVMLKLRRRR